MKRILCICVLLLNSFLISNSKAKIRVKRSVVSFGRMIRSLTGRSPLDYYRYGNWCGLGGGGPPVDGVDNCCKVHDECYVSHNNQRECRGFFNVRAYLSLYNWSYDSRTKTIICSPQNRKCQQILCNCDKAGAECFARNEYHPQNKRSLIRKCGK